MAIPHVVIVGRPNVGKSTIFNWLARKRVTITDETPGVTRDRVEHLLHEGERYFELVDTGGMGFDDPDQLSDAVEEQISMALESAAVILFVLDAQAGRLPMDEKIAKRLRGLKAPIVFVANKCDNNKLEEQSNEFYSLGKAPLVKVSAIHNRGRDDLMDKILELLPAADAASSRVEPAMKIAIVGRPNVGKSTFVNTLVNAKRMIVSEVPGTTRDSVDVRFELDGKSFIAIDTPGSRRQKGIKNDVAFYSMTRTEASIRRADVVLLFFDASQRISKHDKQIAAYVTENYKPCIFVVNKWDLYAGTIPTEKWANYLRDAFRTMWYGPIAFVTGQTGKNVKALLNHAQMLFKQARTRVSTSELNRVLQAALEANPPPMYNGRRPKIYYATQASTEPPSLVLVCNRTGGFDHTYQRYLLGVLRDQLPFSEVPIKLYLRRREAGEKKSDARGEKRSGKSA